MANVTHIVLFRYRDNISWTKLESHFRDFAALKHTCLKDGKPYMLSMRMGKNTSWENFGRGMTHCFVLEFASEADRDYYLIKDKVHHAFSELAGPLIEDSVVVDLKDGALFDEIITPTTSTSGLTLYETNEKLMDGSCHCKNVKWEVNLDDYKHIICHCRTCQLLGGGPYSCNAVVDKDSLRVKEGKLSVYSYTGASGYVVSSFLMVEHETVLPVVDGKNKQKEC